MTQSEQARAWAKVVAYIAVGKPELAKPWAAQLLAHWRSVGVVE